MNKDELIEFLKAEMELEVEYGEDGQLEIVLKVCGEAIDSVEIDCGSRG